MYLVNTDTDISNALSCGSTAAFDEIYMRYHKSVFANISRLVKDTSLAEDILQEVFILFWENRKKMKLSQDPGGWLFVVSYNRSLFHLKQLVKQRIIYVENVADRADETTVQHDVSVELEYELLKQAIETLSPKKREAFELCRLKGKSYAEAAGILNVSSETVKDYLKESLKYIRKFVLSRHTEGALLLSLYLAI